MTEATTRRERLRRAQLTEAGELQLRATQLQNAFHRLTPELSRAERDSWGPVLPALRQVSTKPRDGVGLNDELGAKEAGEGEVFASGTKDRSPGT